MFFRNSAVDPWMPRPPITDLRAATLIVAFLFASMFPLFIHRPPALHEVVIRLRESPDSEFPARNYHRVEIALLRQTRLDGRPQRSLFDLRTGLERLRLEPAVGIELHVHPEVRYEEFLEILAVLKRADFRHLRIVDDNWVAPAPAASATGLEETKPIL